MINGVIKKSKEKTYEEIKANILEAAYNYSIYNELGYNKVIKKVLTFEEIRNKGYLENQDLIDPRDNSEIKGCIIYFWDEEHNQYVFEFDEECNPENQFPDIAIDVKNSVNSSGWTQDYISFEITGGYESYKYCVGDNNCEPNRVYQTVVTSEKTGEDIYVCATGYADDMEGKSICTEAYKVDPEKPKLVVNSISTTSSRIIISATCNDNVSGVKEILYSNDDGNTWNSGSNSYVFSNLTSGTYKVRVKCVDNALNETYDNETSEDVALEKIKNPTIAQISQQPENVGIYPVYAQSRTVRVSYDGTGITTPEYYFKSNVSFNTLNISTVSTPNAILDCGSGKEPGICSTARNFEPNKWYKVNDRVFVDLVYYQEGKIYARTYDSSGNVAETQFKVENIDASYPNVSVASISTTSNSAKVIASCDDSESGIYKYYFKKGSESWIDNGQNSVYEFNELVSDTTYSFSVKCVNNADLTSTNSKTALTKLNLTPQIVQRYQQPVNSEYAQLRRVLITYTEVEDMTEHYFKSTSEAEMFALNWVTIPLYSCGNGSEPSNCTRLDSQIYYYINADTWYKVGTYESVNVATQGTPEYVNYYYDPIIFLDYYDEGELTAYTKYYDEENETSWYSNYSILNFDNQKPTGSVSVDGMQVSATLKDNIGVVAYSISNSSSSPSTWINVDNLKEINIAFTSTTYGTHYLWVKDSTGLMNFVQYIVKPEEKTILSTSLTLEDGCKGVWYLEDEEGCYQEADSSTLKNNKYTIDTDVYSYVKITVKNVKFEDISHISGGPNCAHAGRCTYGFYVKIGSKEVLIQDWSFDHQDSVSLDGTGVLGKNTSGTFTINFDDIELEDTGEKTLKFYVSSGGGSFYYFSAQVTKIIVG